MPSEVAAAFAFIGLICATAGGCGGRRLYALEARMSARQIPIPSGRGKPRDHKKAIEEMRTWTPRFQRIWAGWEKKWQAEAENG